MSNVVRLLGGSHHAKKITIDNLYGPLIMRKKTKQRRWEPWIDPYEIFKTEEEIYERKVMQKPIFTDGLQWLIEFRVAYVKCGADIKPATFWKLALKSHVSEEWHVYGKA